MSDALPSWKLLSWLILEIGTLSDWYNFSLILSVVTIDFRIFTVFNFNSLNFKGLVSRIKYVFIRFHLN